MRQRHHDRRCRARIDDLDAHCSSTWSLSPPCARRRLRLRPITVSSHLAVPSQAAGRHVLLNAATRLYGPWVLAVGDRRGGVGGVWVVVFWALASVTDCKDPWSVE